MKIILSLLLLTSCATSKRKYDPLELAVHRGDFEQIKKSLDNGHPIDRIIQFGNNLLGQSIAKCRLDFVRYLVERGADINKYNFNSYRKAWRRGKVIHYAAQHGCPGILEYSVSHLGMSVDLLNHRKTSPISIAAGFGNVDAVDALISLGADLKSKVYGKSYNNREEWIRYTNKRRVELNNYIEESRRKRIAKRRGEQKARETKAKDGDSWFGKVLAIGTVAGIASSSGISSANQLKVISATATDVINDTGGTNLQKLKNQASTSRTYPSATNSSPSAPVAKTTQKPQIRRCSLKDKTCLPNAYQVCFIKQTKSVGCYFKRTKFNTSIGHWQYDTGAPSHRQCPTATGYSDSYGGGAFSKNSAFHGQSGITSSDPRGDCLAKCQEEASRKKWNCTGAR